MADRTTLPAITATLAFADTATDYAAFGELCAAYTDWCRARYADMGWFVEQIFDAQSLAAELENLPQRYGPSVGNVLLARRDGVVVGGGAYRRLTDDVCELKRLYIGTAARGLGLGRILSEHLISAARAGGYTRMRLDTGDRMDEAIALYEGMGFARIAPYHAYPPELVAHLVFMELNL